MIYVWAGIAGIILAMAGIIGYEHRQIDKAIADLTAYKQSVAVTAAQARQEQADKIAAQERSNAVTLSNLQATLDDSHAAGADLARRLRIATAALSSRPVQGAGDQSKPDAAPGIAQSPAGVDEALAKYDATCQRDSARLGALQAELRPQL